MSQKNRKVFIVNKGPHNFNAAEPYGEFVFLCEGPMDRYGCSNMLRMFAEAMKDSHEDDHIVPCSLNVMNAIACALFARKHGKLNLLLFKNGKYLERNLIIE